MFLIFNKISIVQIFGNKNFFINYVLSTKVILQLIFKYTELSKIPVNDKIARSKVVEKVI